MRSAAIAPDPYARSQHGFRVLRRLPDVLDGADVAVLPGHEAESTYCHSCGKPVITRAGFRIIKKNMNGPACASCGAWRR